MTDELKTDEEELREASFSEGPKTAAKLKFALRAITALSMSQMQRNGFFDDAMDIMQKTAGFVFLHSAAKDDVRDVVNNKEKFLNAVDDWMESNVTHHQELEPYAEEMNAAFEQYMAAQSTGGGIYHGNGSKN